MFVSSLILMSVGGFSILVAIFAEYDWKDKPQNRVFSDVSLTVTGCNRVS